MKQENNIVTHCGKLLKGDLNLNASSRRLVRLGPSEELILCSPRGNIIVESLGGRAGKVDIWDDGLEGNQ